MCVSDEGLADLISDEYLEELAEYIRDSGVGCPKCEIEWANGAWECPHCGTMNPNDEGE